MTIFTGTKTQSRCVRHKSGCRPEVTVKDRKKEGVKADLIDGKNA